MIFIYKDSVRNIGLAVKLCFRITLHVKDRAILDKIREYFDGGLVTSYTDCPIRFESLKDLESFITHFDKFPLRKKNWKLPTFLSGFLHG